MQMIMAFVIVELTVLTGYLHYTLGGDLFILNALGYLVLGSAYSAAMFLPIALLRRFAWLPRIGLLVYTLVTIGAYVVMGPYFSIGWVAKGIEVAIIALLVADILGAYGSSRGLWRAALGSLQPRSRSTDLTAGQEPSAASHSARQRWNRERTGDTVPVRSPRAGRETRGG